MQKCPHCSRVFRYQINEYQAHLLLCEKRKLACALCPLKFKLPAYLARHMRCVHPGKGVLKNAKQDQNQVKNIMRKSKVSSLNSSSNMNDIEDRDISTAKKDMADNSMKLCEKTKRFHPDESSSKNIQIDPDKKQVQDNDLLMEIVENPSKQPYSCNICGITMLTNHQIRYHKASCLN